MAALPKCPECEGTMTSVGNAWLCTDCQEYFMDHELPELPRKMRRRREYEADDE